MEAANRGYEGRWGHNYATAAEWAQWLPTLDPRSIFFLFDAAGDIAGVARAAIRTQDERPVGVVDAPGVVPEMRGAGLYRLLLLHALAWLVSKHPNEYLIESWGDDPSVLDDYRTLGFETSRRETLYRYQLEPPRESEADERS